jgi:hypothetical protein
MRWRAVVAWAVLVVAGCGGVPPAASVSSSTTVATVRVTEATTSPTTVSTMPTTTTSTAVPAQNRVGTPGVFSAVIAADASRWATESCAAARAADGGRAAAAMAYGALEGYGDRFPEHRNDDTWGEWLRVFIGG